MGLVGSLLTLRCAPSPCLAPPPQGTRQSPPSKSQTLGTWLASCTVKQNWLEVMTFVQVGCVPEGQPAASPVFCPGLLAAEALPLFLQGRGPILSCPACPVLPSYLSVPHSSPWKPGHVRNDPCVQQGVVK